MASNPTTPKDAVSTEIAHSGQVPPWATDLATIFFRGGKAMVQADQLPLVQFARLHEFDSQVESEIQILVGGKGTGKSTALVRKAAKLSTAGIDVIPNHLPYVNQLEAEALRFVPERLALYSTAKTWTQLWKLVLSAIFGLRIAAHSSKVRQRLQREGSYGKLLKCPSGSNEERFFDEVQSRYTMGAKQRTEPITPIIGHLIDRSMSETECFRWYSNYIKPLINEAPDDYRAAIFLDCVDEAFGHSISEELQVSNGHLVWAAAQVGLIDAAYELARQQSGLRVYAAIRQEAYRQYAHMGLRGIAQIDTGICLQMEYTEGELVAIFEDNVKRTADADLADKHAKSAVLRFFGTDAFHHPRVWGAQEPVLQWLMRHTFGSPRHLVWHGSKILTIPAAKRSERAAIAPTVNGLATQIFEEYRGQLIPTWDKRVDEFFALIDRNVMPASHAKAIDARVKRDRGIEPFLYLFQRGMLGYPVPDEGMRYRYRQRFLPAGTWLDKTELPAADYFVVHPCLNQVIESRLPTERQASFVGSRFIAGAGLSCPEKISAIKYCLTLEPESRAPLFCHFPDGVDDITPDLVWRHRIEELSEVDTGSTALFLALLCASTEPVDGGYVSKERLVRHVERLRKQGILMDSYGRGDTRDVSEQYFLNLMVNWTVQQPQVVSDLKEKLARLLPGVELKARAGASGSREALMLNNVHRSAVLISLH